MALKGKDVELAGMWLTQVKTVAESAEDPDLKDTAKKLGEALTAMLGTPEAAASAEAAVVAQAAANSQTADAAVALAASVRKLVGKDKSEEIAATISSWKASAEKSAKDSTEFETLRASVDTLSARVLEGDIKEVLAANRDKCNPAFEAWAMKRNDKGQLVRSVEDVTEAIATREVVKAPSKELPAPGAGTPTGGLPEGITLTKEDLEVCASLNTKPEEFLKHKIEISKTERARFAAGL